MRTTISRPAGALEDTVYHTLADGESWKDFGMEQAGRTFSHRGSWPVTCPACRFHMAHGLAEYPR